MQLIKETGCDEFKEETLVFLKSIVIFLLIMEKQIVRHRKIN